MKKLLAGILVVLTLVCVLSVAGCHKVEPALNPSTTATTTRGPLTNPENPLLTSTTTDPFNPCPTVPPTTTTTTTTTTIPPSSDHDCFPDNSFGFDDVRCADQNNWGKVVKGVFTSDKGGLQMRAKGWKTYGLSNISMVPVEYNNQGVTNAICVAVYNADSADVFANKTEADFEAVLGADINTFTPITICGYPAYYAVVPNQMYVYVINTPTHKYFINFMQAPGFPDVEPIATKMMSKDNILIFK